MITFYFSICIEVFQKPLQQNIHSLFVTLLLQVLNSVLCTIELVVFQCLCKLSEPLSMCYSLVLPSLPIYNLMVYNGRRYSAYQVCGLVMGRGPYPKESLHKNSTIVYIFLYPFLRIWDNSVSFYQGIFASSRSSKPIPLFCGLLHVRSDWNYRGLLISIHSFLCHLTPSSIGGLFSRLRRSIGISSMGLFLFSRETLSQSIWNRLFQLNLLSFPYFEFLANTKYEKPSDFNRVERAFLNPMVL